MTHERDTRAPELPVEPDPWGRIVGRIETGSRFAGLYGTDRDGSCEIGILLAGSGDIERHTVLVTPAPNGRLEYPSLSASVPAAFWYERAMHDLSGVTPVGHPRLDPLLLPLDDGVERPHPGRVNQPGSVASAEPRGPVDLAGQGMFTLPFGPVRSGVHESIEFLIETPGEDIPYLNIRPHYKHRGTAKHFEGRTLAEGVLVAERVEGISSIAHALAYCQAAERILGCDVPLYARLTRVVYAELERISNHLDATMRMCDAAGLAVATARFGWHKETAMRLVSSLCGSRFGRNVVTVGGVNVPPLDVERVASQVRTLHDGIRSDLKALDGTASFLDRQRMTGPLTAERAREFGALGPIGRASGFDVDNRRDLPYAAYADIKSPEPPELDAGDALARARVRWHEISTSVYLLLDALAAMADEPVHPLTESESMATAQGFATGWTESAQGEVVYALEVESGRIRRCLARSPSFHNLLLFHHVFAGDIFTDFPFIEASFGLGYAGVAM